MGDRRLDEGVLVRPAPPRRGGLAVDDLDGQPLGHRWTVGRSGSAVYAPHLAVTAGPRRGWTRERSAAASTTAGGPGPGRHPRRRPRGERRPGAHLDGEGRRGRRPPRRLPRDDPDRVSGGGPRPAGVLRARHPARPRRPRDQPGRRRARRGRRRRRVPRAHRGQRAGPGRPAADGRRPARGRQPAPRRPPQRGRAALRRRGRRALLQAAPAELRRLRRGPLLRAGHRAADRPPARRRHRTDRVRGPLGRARSLRRRRARGRGPRLLPQRLAVRAGQGRPAAAAGQPAGRGGEGADPLLQPGRRAGRAGLRRRLAGRHRRRRAAGPRAPVRRAPADRRPVLRPRRRTTAPKAGSAR